MKFPSTLAALALLGICAPLAGCGSEATAEAGTVPPPIEDCTDAYECAGRKKLKPTAPTELEGLHNVFKLSDNIISGGEPLTDGALKAVADMGVKTILSVDGKAPNAELAKKLGMRYVHVPIRYGGLTGDQATKIAKTFREQKPPFYVHCFHGKHRGPCGAAVGRIVLDEVSREQALAEMRQWSGAARKYSGLYVSIATGDIPTAKTTEAFTWDFPAQHKIDGVRAGMVHMTRAFDNVKWLAKREWKPDANHPDIDAVNETAQLVQHFDQFVALKGYAARPADYKAWMTDSVKSVRELATAVKAHADGDSAAAGLATKKLAVLKNLCGACHKPYRNK